MIRVFFHGQRVPNWLLKVKPNGATGKVGTITFQGIAIVYNRGQQYFIKPVISIGHASISVWQDNQDVILCFRSPVGSKKPAIFQGPAILFDIPRLFP